VYGFSVKETVDKDFSSNFSKKYYVYLKYHSKRKCDMEWDSSQYKIVITDGYPQESKECKAALSKPSWKPGYDICFVLMCDEIGATNPYIFTWKHINVEED
jgi:hypothetical protein